MLDQIIQLINHHQWLFTLLGCVAIWKPKGVQIAKKYLSNSYDNNTDGAGFAYAKGGKIVISKGYFDFEEFWKAFKPFQNLPCLIHFRIATHGKVDEANCHPFPMRDGKYALVHNGVMPSGLHSGKKEESDTKQFAAKLETCIETVPWNHDNFTCFINEAISYNKVAVLREDGKVWLFNEGKGEWHKGAWFSNHTYAYAPTKWTGAGAAKNYGKTADLSYGSKANPVYSSVHECAGFYDENGDWQPVAGDDYSECEELTDEEIASLAEIDPADLAGDMEFMPETEQERYVQRWLAVQAAKANTTPKKEEKKIIQLPPQGVEARESFPDYEPTGSYNAAMLNTDVEDWQPQGVVQTGEPSTDLAQYHPHPFVGRKPMLPC